MNEVIRVPFVENEITVIEANGVRYVALKPLVEALGLNWVAQYELLHRDPVLRKEVLVLQCQTNGGVQTMTCLPIDFLNGWLFKIPASRYTGAQRETIIKYQNECYRALNDYFRHGGAINPDISIEQAKAVSEEIARQVGAKIDAMLAQHRRDMAKADAQVEQDVLRKFLGQ